MRITKELNEYIHKRVDKLVPDPISKEESDKVFKGLEKIEIEFKEEMRAFAENLIEEYRKRPEFEGCSIEYSEYSRLSLSTRANKSKAVLDYNREAKECAEFKNDVVLKTIALLSAQKEVSDLDAFIANVISSIK